jgi:enamine deaminase RidA (YjgF/YER057c/UK114 family)
MASFADWGEQFKYADYVRAGNLVFFSGQVGIDESGKSPADPVEQYRLAFESLSRVLAQAGCTPADVVDLMTYHTHYPEHMEQFMAAKAAFQGAARPAWTAVGVAKLGMPETIVEIKATAYIEAGGSAATSATS